MNIEQVMTIISVVELCVIMLLWSKYKNLEQSFKELKKGTKWKHQN